jgi:hypothetical protein
LCRGRAGKREPLRQQRLDVNGQDWAGTLLDDTVRRRPEQREVEGVSSAHAQDH